MTLMNPLGEPLAPPPARPRLRRVQAIVNAASGGVGPGAAALLAERMAAHGYELTLVSPLPNELDRAITAAVDAAPDLLIVLAGDGTARLAAERCGPDGPLLAALPGGTLNMLPHVLYGERAWPDALEAALEHGEARDICGGRIGGHSFYVAAIVGAPARWGAAREALRAGKIKRAWRRAGYALRRAFTGRIRYTLDGLPSRDAEALVLISPVVSRALAGRDTLEVAELDVHNAREMFRLAFHGLVGAWRQDPGITVYTSRHGRAGALRPIPCILDGEVHRLTNRVEFEFVPRAFRALALPGSHGAVL
jgi:diacylglycerol kinase family enzyme